MRQRLSVTMAVVALAAMAQVAQKPPVAKSYKDLRYPPLNKIKAPEAARYELPNGMVVYLVEDRELPTITVSALVRTGDRWEALEKAGVASITGTVMRTGGSTTRSGDQLDEELDRLGASVETSIGEDSGDASVSVLKEDIDTGLSILADILQHPAFPEDKIELAKIQEREGIARRNDDPGEIASREFERVLFGKNSAYGHIPEYATIDAITRADLIAFHKRFFQPENVILGVWGDFKTEEMRAQIEKALGGWARGGQSRPAAPELEPGARKRAGIYAIEKDDVNQSTVYMGFVGGQRNDPDYFALSVANTILGSGFSSRLLNHVRVEQALAYQVGSSWSAGWDRPGMFRAIGGTKSQTTVKMVNAIRNEIAKMPEGVTDEELAKAKDQILKGFAFEFDSTGKIVGRMMRYEYFGYPRDYLQTYQANIEKVTTADVARVAKQYLKTDDLAILVLGKSKDFDQPLASLGKVTAIDITIPKPKQEALAAPTAEAVAKGKALLTKSREAMGGAALLAVKDYTVVGNMALSMPQGELSLKMEATQNLGGKMLTKLATPIGGIVQGYDGKVFWRKSPQGVQEMPPSAAGEVEGNLFRDTIWLMQNIENPALTVQWLGSAEAGGTPVEGIAVSDPARKLTVTLYVDAKTGLLVKKVYTASMMGPPSEMEEFYSDYRDAQGVKMPFKAVVNSGGKKRAEQTITEVKINPGVAEAAYQKP
ncbi:MAG: M16 family metallopeptidase [Bryobacteraceae bacterium]